MYPRIMVVIGDSFATCHALDETIFAQRTAAIMLSSPVADGERNLGRDAQRLIQKASCSLLRVRTAGVL